MRALWLPVLLLPGCIIPIHLGDRPPWPEDPLSGVAFTAGPTYLEDEAYGSLDTLTTLGVEITEDYGMAPFFLEGGLRYGFDRDRRRSGGERITSELARLELSAGMRLAWPLARASLAPYAGLGGALVFVSADLDEEDDDHDNESDAAFGIYGKIGLALPLAPGTFLAFELRAIEGGSISTDAFDADIDSTQVAIVFGLAF